MKRKIFVFIGAPASGKGTRIMECKECESISTSSLLRKKGYDLSKGTLINDEDVCNLVIERIMESKSEKIILDGFPRTENQFWALRKKGIRIDKVFYIKAPKTILLERAKNRLTCIKCQASFTKTSFKKPQNYGICDLCGGKLVERPDDSKEIFMKRLDVFFMQTKPIIKLFEKYLVPIIEIDATLPPKEILKYI